MLLLCEGEEGFGGQCGEAAGEGVHGEAEAAVEGLGAGSGRQEADLEETALCTDAEVLRPRGVAFVEAVLLYLYNLGSKFQPFLFHCLFGLADEGSDKHAALARCLLPFRLVGGELPRGVFAAYDDRALQRVAEKQEIAVGCVAALADGEGDLPLLLPLCSVFQDKRREKEKIGQGGKGRWREGANGRKERGEG